MNPVTRVLLRGARTTSLIWVGSLVVLALSSFLGTKGLYPSAASRYQAALGIDASRALVALYGPVPLGGSLGSLAIVKLLSLGALGSSLGGAIVAARLSRGLEESGELELLALGRVGWRNVAGRGDAVALFAGALLGLLVAATSLAGGLSLGGSLLIGADLAGAWMFGVATALVLAQRRPHARTVRLAAAIVLLALYLVRAIGDASSPLHRLGVLSPFRWLITTSPFDQPRVVPLLGVFALTALLVVGARTLRERRDLGGPVLEHRRGPRRVATRPIVGWWRRHRLLILVATGGSLLLSAVLSSVSGQLSGLLSSANAAQYFRELGGPGGVRDQIHSLALLSSAELALATGTALLVSRTRDERSGARALVDTVPSSRERGWWSELGGDVVAVAVVSLTGLVLLGASPRLALLLAVLSRLVGTILLATFALALVSLGPPANSAWAPLLVTVLAGEVAPLTRALSPLTRLSPYWWIGSSFSQTSMGALAVEIVLAVGLVAFARSLRAAREWA